MFKKLIFTILIVSSNFCAAEIYVVDVQKILSESSAGKTAKQALEAKFAGTKKNLEKQRDQLQVLQGEIKQQSTVMSQEALKNKVMAYREKEQQAAKAFQEYQEGFAKDNSAKISKIMTEVRSILEGLAKEKKTSLILEKSPQIVLFADDSVDLTDEVVDQLNQKKIKF